MAYAIGNIADKKHNPRIEPLDAFSKIDEANACFFSTFAYNSRDSCDSDEPTSK